MSFEEYPEAEASREWLEKLREHFTNVAISLGRRHQPDDSPAYIATMTYAKDIAESCDKTLMWLQRFIDAADAELETARVKCAQAQDQAAKSAHSEVFFRLIASRACLGEIHRKELPWAAFRAVLGKLPPRVQLEAELEACITRLEELDNPALGKPKRAIDVG